MGLQPPDPLQSPETDNPANAMFETCGPAVGPWGNEFRISNAELVPWANLRARQKGDSKREKPDPERTFSQIFADFRWFSGRSVNQGIWEAQICAENRRKPQIFAGNRRKPQIFAETGFSHLLSPFWRAPKTDFGLLNLNRGQKLSWPCNWREASPEGRFVVKRHESSIYLVLGLLAFIDMFSNSFEVTQRSVTRSRCWQTDLLTQQTPFSPPASTYWNFWKMSLHD